MMLLRREPGPQRSPKRQLFDGAGYEFEIEHAVFVNWQARKVFSSEFVQAHSLEELNECVNVHPTPAAWRFYFNDPPGPYVRRKLEEDLELR